VEVVGPGGQRVTEQVVIRAGQQTSVTLQIE
jgi:hypothetical protein